DICAAGFGNLGRGIKRLCHKLPKLHRAHLGMGELLRQMIGERALEIAMIEKRDIEEAGEHGLTGRHLLCFLAKALPYGIADRKRLVTLDGLRHINTPRHRLAAAHPTEPATKAESRHSV